MKTYKVSIHLRTGVSYNGFRFGREQDCQRFIDSLFYLVDYSHFDCESEDNGIVEKNLFKPVIR